MTPKSYEDFNKFKKETKTTNIFLSSIGAITSIYSHMKTRSNTIHFHFYLILQMNQFLKKVNKWLLKHFYHMKEIVLHMFDEQMYPFNTV